MVTSRGAFFLGLSLIVCVAMLIYGPQIGKFRYLTVPTNQGLFILDTKTQMMNVCTDKNCRIVPHEVSGGQVPGMQPTYGQMQMTPVSSLGIVENTGMPGGFSCGNGVCVMPMPMQQPQNMQPQQKPIVIEERPVAQEMMAPEPVRPQPIEFEPARIEPRPAAPAVQAPIIRLAPQPQVLMQQRPAFQSTVQRAPIVQPNSAEARVRTDEMNLQATEQALGLGR